MKKVGFLIFCLFAMCSMAGKAQDVVADSIGYIVKVGENLPDFFRKMKLLLRPGGCVLMDSSNLSYLFEEEDGSIVIDLAGDYYGEVDFQMQYKNVKGDSFDWLYIDFQTLSLYAAENGFTAELVKEGTHYDYLAKLSRQA